jgi:anti-sigma B factor antagonist
MLARRVMELTSRDSQYAGRRRRFTFDVAQTPGAILMTLGGELDVVCADAFKRRFSDATEDEPAHIVIDLRELTFIDSTGLALLLGINEMARDGGFALSLVSTQDDAARKIFRMTGTERLLPLVDEPPDVPPSDQ